MDIEEHHNSEETFETLFRGYRWPTQTVLL